MGSFLELRETFVIVLRVLSEQMDCKKSQNLREMPTLENAGLWERLFELVRTARTREIYP